MKEKYTIKEKLLLTAAGSMVFSVLAIAWGIPGEWLLGWPVWKLAALMIAMTAVLFGAVMCVVFGYGIVCDIIRQRRITAERRRCDAVRLSGRSARYVSRDVVCRASGRRI